MADPQRIESVDVDRPRYIRADIYNHAEDLRRKVHGLRQMRRERMDQKLAECLARVAAALLSAADELDARADEQPEMPDTELPFK
jgi:hypothetical protein